MVSICLASSVLDRVIPNIHWGRNAAGILLFVALSLTGSKAVAEVSLVSDGRITTFIGEFGTSTQIPGAPFAAFDAGTFAGGQRSTVSTSLMTASGFGALFPGDPSERGTSTFLIDFAVDANTEIQLSGELDLDYPDPTLFPHAIGEVDLIDLDAGQTLFSFQQHGTFDFADVLTTGNYRIRAFGAGGFDQTYVSEGRYDLTLVLIPEPSTAILLGLGMIGLGISARRPARLPRAARPEATRDAVSHGRRRAA